VGAKFQIILDYFNPIYFQIASRVPGGRWSGLTNKTTMTYDQPQSSGRRGFFPQA
jgi:hypothetical protein